jgi:hypothetical protein
VHDIVLALHEIVLALSVSPTGDWTQAAAIMTFAIPVGIFVVVATWLYFLYTRPHAVPGHRELVPAGTGRHAAGAARPAAVQPPSAPQPPPAAPPPGGGYQQGGGYPPASGGGQGGYEGTEGRE